MGFGVAFLISMILFLAKVISPLATFSWLWIPFPFVVVILFWLILLLIAALTLGKR